MDAAHNKIRPRLCAREYKTKMQGKIQRAIFAAQLFSALPPLELVKALVSIMMSVGLSINGKPLKLRHYDISRAHFQGTALRLICVRLPAEDRQKFGEDKAGRLIKSTYITHCASHIWQLDFVNLIGGESGGFRRGKHSAAMFHNSNQDVRMAVCSDDFVSFFVRRRGESVTSAHFSESKCTAKDMETLRFEDWDAKSLQLMNRVSFELGQIKRDSSWTLNLIRDTHHSSSKTLDATRTPRQVDATRMEEPDSEEGATRYRSACVKHSYFARDRSDLAENREAFGPENE